MTNFSRQAMRRNIYLLTAFLLWGLVPGVRGADDGTTKLEKDADGYYLVSNTDDLAELARIVNNGSVRDIRVRQTEDIDMSGVSWTPIGNGPIFTVSSARSIEGDMLSHGESNRTVFGSGG